MALIILLGVMLWVHKQTNNPNSTTVDDSVDNWMKRKKI